MKLQCDQQAVKMGFPYCTHCLSFALFICFRDTWEWVRQMRMLRTPPPTQV